MWGASANASGLEAAMFLAWHLPDAWAVTGALTWLLCAPLALGLTRLLWSLRWRLSRDPRNPLPLPQGSMGWPLVGETLHWLVQVSERMSVRTVEIFCCQSAERVSLENCNSSVHRQLIGDQLQPNS